MENKYFITITCNACEILLPFEKPQKDFTG